MGLNTLIEYADIPSAAAADISVESVIISDHTEGTVDPSFIAITPIDVVPHNIVVAERGNASTTAEANTWGVPLYPRSIFWEFHEPITSIGGDYKSISYYGRHCSIFRDIFSSVTGLGWDFSPESL